MAAIIWADVVAHAAGLAAVQALARVDILAYVNQNVNVRKFGGEASSKLRLARIYLAAHLGEIWARESDPDHETAPGEVTKETLSSTSVSLEYAETHTSSDDALSATSYGRQYASLANRSAARVGIIPGRC